MTNTFQGNLYANKTDKFCIIVSRFNEFIGSKLLSGAVDSFVRLGVDEENIDIIWFPGSFELPLMAKKAAKKKKYCAIVTLGAVIKGSTSHYDYVCAELSKGIASVSLSEGLPVYLEFLQRIISSRQLNEQVQKRVIRALQKRRRLLRW